MKKGFISVSLPLFKKKLGKSIYDVSMTHYDAMPVLLLFRFVANAQGL